MFIVISLSTHNTDTPVKFFMRIETKKINKTILKNEIIEYM